MLDDLISDICSIEIDYKDIEKDMRIAQRTISSLFILLANLFYIPFFLYKILLTENKVMTIDLLLLLESLTILFFVGLYVFIKAIYASIKYLKDPHVNNYIAVYCFKNIKRFDKNILSIIIEFLIFWVLGIFSLYFLITKNFNLDAKLFVFMGITNSLVFMLFPLIKLFTVFKNDIWANEFIMDIFINYIRNAALFTFFSIIFNI